MLPECASLERPDDSLHYRNLQPQDPTSYLRSLIEKIKSSELIPAGSEQFGREYHDDNDAEVVCTDGIELEMLIIQY